ncbi:MULTISPECIES: ImmA/IrrE family metallo-endopeptidase [Pseudoalteromonas]|nr:hypothetical protein [Pseudoalteromonas nigrifaciens]GEN42586.1 hypothetical protein PNI02_20520 [Pseudoalteromonas nigrifaciens]SUC52069.1 Uncharacterised protein [Pseudoalteromonas nigrifaciens]
MPENYRLRGNRVSPLPLSQIKVVAENFAKAFDFKRRNRRNLDKNFELLYQLRVTLEVVDDKDWIFLTKGHCDPSKAIICVPQSIYNNACIGEQEALAVMLHELGHLFLGHRSLMHYSDKPAEEIEDAEWQADMFAEIILSIMGYETKQLSFDFYG